MEESTGGSQCVVVIQKQTKLKIAYSTFNPAIKLNFKSLNMRWKRKGEEERKRKKEKVKWEMERGSKGKGWGRGVKK